MDCPRCHVLLGRAEYESQQVMFCATCWGYWLSRDQLDQITSTIVYQFSPEERDAVEKTFGDESNAGRHGRDEIKLACPQCDGVMTKKKYHLRCPVQIDECKQHGIWLDTGEIKDLQVFMERHAHH